MFQEFGTSESCSHCSLYEMGHVTSTNSKGPLKTMKSLCRSLVVWIFCGTKSSTLKLWALMLHEWYCLISYWSLSTKWPPLHVIPPVWLSHRLGSHLTTLQKTARLGKICVLLKWVTLPRSRILVKMVCGPWLNSGSCVEPTRPMTTLSSTSQHKNLAHQKFRV
jgi:hypothetical protein